MKLNENIKKLRIEKDMTQEEVGKRVAVSKQTIQRYESGEISNIPYDKVVGLAEVFSVSPGYLMGWEKPSVDDAEMLADIAGDRKLMKYISYIKEASEEDREKIYSYIEFVCSKK